MMDILAEINAWDAMNGKTIARYCGVESLSLYQYLVALEKVRTDIDKLIPLHPVYNNIVLATIDAFAEGANGDWLKMDSQADRFLAHLLNAKQTLQAGRGLSPVERQSLTVCLTVLIAQIGSFLATAQMLIT